MCYGHNYQIYVWIPKFMKGSTLSEYQTMNINKINLRACKYGRWK